MLILSKKSSILILIVICLVIVLSSGGIFTIYLTHTIKPDAEIINKLGVIRGSIQRLVKLETGGIESSELMDVIESDISKFYDKKIKVYDKKGEIQRAIDNLSQSWISLKDEIFKYRDNRSTHQQKLLLENSEGIWEEANTMVLVSQIVSERKITNYQISYVFFGINLILGVTIIFLIKRHVQDNLEYFVNYDEMTNTYNRRYFNGYLKNEITKIERYNKKLSLILFDIDFFKKVNDNYGHDVGDSVLKELSKLVQANLRKCDLFCRIGGEEFAILTPETGINNAFIMSEKIRVIVEKHGFEYVNSIRISLGIAQFVQGDNSDSIFKRADLALYRAKEGGRNRSEIEEA